MKRLLVLAILLPCLATAQTEIQKEIAVQADESLKLRFDYPKVRITTWNEPKILVTGSVSINGGENDDAFELRFRKDGSVITLEDEIHNLKSLPHRIKVVTAGKSMQFKSQKEFAAFAALNGKIFDSKSEGVDIDIALEIKVPASMSIDADMKYGLLEAIPGLAPFSASSTYGGVDLSVDSNNWGDLVAETNYGTIYSNLAIDPGTATIQEEDFHMRMVAHRPSGSRYKAVSKYGNVYLRKK
ncbi:MAG: hypothetical protein K1X47_07935 [Cyclobacteriaceae bacterium]|nr:hypothetical protein [Cyclobacteriaceae bacterium]